jgi:hypothetical protein
MSTQNAQDNTIATRVGKIQPNIAAKVVKSVVKWVDCYLNCCYNSGLTTQRG